MPSYRLETPFKVERRGPSAGEKFGRGGSGDYAIVSGLDEEWARLTPKQGGELALAARIEGRQAWELVVRRTPATLGITSADRITTLDDLALELNVAACAPFQPDPEYLLITATTGAASG